jgi:hypothetical protein
LDKLQPQLLRPSVAPFHTLVKVCKPSCQSNPPNPNPCFASFWPSDLHQHSISFDRLRSLTRSWHCNCHRAKLRLAGKGYVQVRGHQPLFMTIRDSAFPTLACSRNQPPLGLGDCVIPYNFLFLEQSGKLFATFSLLLATVGPKLL